MKKIRIGILKETKTPPDRRVAITPLQGKEILRRFPQVELFAQPSPLRCFSDREYARAGIALKSDLSDCDILIGVKEVKISTLIPEKTYLFFAHVGKKQPYNRALLQAVLKKKIRLLDYEYLTTPGGARVVAFGRWAGIVGAYNGLRGWGVRTGDFELKPAHKFRDKQAMYDDLKNLRLSPLKILITGGGRVAHGAMETLKVLNIREVSPKEFLNQEFDEPTVCRIDPEHYVERKDGKPFDLKHFFDHPAEYRSTFLPYTKTTDLFIPCHYWAPRSPVFITPAEMRNPGFRIKMIADVSCDIKDPIPSTLRASTIAEPFYGYNPQTEKEDAPFAKANITVMAVDNLPGELPRDASEDFGNTLLEKVYPALLKTDPEKLIERATIAENGHLSPHFSYLEAYAQGNE